MSVLLSQKGKCTGCKALVRTKDSATGNHIFVCSLAFRINFTQAGKNALSPRPAVKCYRPTTSAELKESQRIVDKKTANMEPEKVAA
jgi:hypothetical protein